MRPQGQDRRIWDAATTLEALGGAQVALWVWEPAEDSLRLFGAARQLGLGPLAPECSSAAFRALALPADRAAAEELLRVHEPGTEVTLRIKMRGGEACLWRGVWLEEGVRASGVVAPETRFAASEIDQLTGLLRGLEGGACLEAAQRARRLPRLVRPTSTAPPSARGCSRSPGGLK
jgi:c-di-GMP-specific phosphodiesterase